MLNSEREHYELLRKNYNFLVRIILGTNYYIESSQVYNADIEAFRDMKLNIYKLKSDLKIYKKISKIMFIFIIILLILLIL